MATIYGANTLSSGYDVANSCRFNNDDSPYLSRNMASQGSSIKGSFSAWVKPSSHNSDKCLMTHYYNNSYFFSIHFQDDNSFMVKDYRTSNIMVYYTSAVYRDLSSWYNFVVIVDRSLGTANDRVKIFINGTRLTSANSGLTVGAVYDQQTSGSHSGNHSMNNDYTLEVGRNQALNGDGYMDGYIAEMVWLDGVAKDVTDFGEFDSNSPTVWKPKDVSGLSSDKGTNGFWLDFEDSSNLGNDAFGGTDFSENNIVAADQSTDTCTNNFATKNANFQTSTVFTEGALVSTHSSNSWQWSPASLAFQNGKWYAEVKVLSHNYSGIGLTDLDDAFGYAPSDTHPGKTAVTPNGRGFFWYYDDGKIYYNDTSTTGPGSFTTNDILMFAIDMTNSKYHFGKNGSWLSSSDPANNSGGFTHQSGGTWTFFDAVGNGGSLSWNYGSPNHSVSSGNADANGYGNFEYSVPSGYYTLNSKNLAEFG